MILFPDMNDDLAKQFERGILFGVGRHFWNFVGVVGLISATVGGGGLMYSYSYSAVKYPKGWCDWIKPKDPDFKCRNKVEDIGEGARLYTPENRIHPRYKEYRRYVAAIPSVEDQESRKLGIRSVSIVALIWGLSSMISASMLSAIFAIERNTRKI